MVNQTYLFDALLVLDEQLDTRDVYVEPGALGRALHGSINASVVLTTHTHTHTHTHMKQSKSNAVQTRRR